MKHEIGKCLYCDNDGWVCENHPDAPWGGISKRWDACSCGAGAPCKHCNPCGGPDAPPLKGIEHPYSGETEQ